MVELAIRTARTELSGSPATDTDPGSSAGSKRKRAVRRETASFDTRDLKTKALLDDLE